MSSKLAPVGATVENAIEDVESTLEVAEMVNHFRRQADSRSFYQAADQILHHIQDPFQLSECAELAGKRQPGGTYYKALLWGRTLDSLTATNEIGRLTDICRVRGVTSNIARSWAGFSNSIERLESGTWTRQYFREFPFPVLDAARRQGDLATEYLDLAAQLLTANPKSTPRQIHNSWCRVFGGIHANLDIIKPSDWWAFSHPKWSQDPDFPGSIPGEIYANALYYFAPQTGVAVDPMAGSGMLKRVYNDRSRWQKELKFDLDLHLYDLYPRRAFITEHDATETLPVKADWIFLDPPYYAQSNHLFQGLLAQTRDYMVYIGELSNILRAMVKSLNPGGRLCILLPKWSGSQPEDPNYDSPGQMKQIATDLGLDWIDEAFVSRGRQQEAGSAMKNISAKAKRRMRSDTCVLNVFEKPKD